MALSEKLRSTLDHHIAQMRELLINLQFAEIGDLWSSFYPTLLRNFQQELQSSTAVAIIEKMDKDLYSSVIKSMLPDVLQFITTTKTKNIRTFGKQAESWMRGSLHGYVAAMIEAKATAVSDFGQKLRRYTGLNHLAQASRGVMVAPGNVESMRADYDRVDFVTIQDQILWLHTCDFDLISRTEADFREFLRRPHTVNDWAYWMQNIMQSFLKKFEAEENFRIKAGEFLIRWSFVSSLIIRDITLRSAASFGLFHLIRLFCDEYMFYLVELAIESSACVAVAHEDYAAEGLADSHSSFQLNEEFEAEIENDDFEFDDSAADAILAGYKHVNDDRFH